MRSSCIRQPERQPLIIIRQWQLEYCEGNKVAAALMSHLEYWHNYQLDRIEAKARDNDILRQKGKPTKKLPDAVQQWTREHLIKALMNITKTPEVLRTAEKLLIEKGALVMPERTDLEKGNNYLFCPEAVNAWINEHYPPEPEFLPDAEQEPEPEEAPEEAPEETPEETPEKKQESEEMQSAWTFAQTHDFWCMRITNKKALTLNMKDGKAFKAQFEQWKKQKTPEAQKAPEREKCPHCENGLIELYKPGELKPEVVRCPHGEKAEKIIARAKAKGMCTNKENSKIIAEEIKRKKTNG